MGVVRSGGGSAEWGIVMSGGGDSAEWGIVMSGGGVVLGGG